MHTDENNDDDDDEKISLVAILNKNSLPGGGITHSVLTITLLFPFKGKCVLY